MRTNSTEYLLFNPPEENPGFDMNDWFTIPAGEPVIEYLVENLWDQPGFPEKWEAARLSKAVFLYREISTSWTILVKFFVAKVSSAESAVRYSDNEFQCTQQALSFRWEDGTFGAPRALGAANGTIFLEYIDGLTLEDTIAIRRNRPGTIRPALKKVATLLAGIHSRNLHDEFPRNFHYEISDIQKIADQLAGKGVLKDNPIVVDGLQKLIARWEVDPVMVDYIPTTIHGDSTTSNFIFPWNGGLIAIDWERMYTADPASELGRLLAEIANGIYQYGGNYDEADQLVQFTRDVYCQALPANWDTKALTHRTKFYQASSTLRIARNGWLPRLQRTMLVSQALAFLV